MASFVLRWSFGELTKKSISHLLICHRLLTTPHHPSAPSDRWIPSQTSLTSGRWTLEVRNGRQVHLTGNFLQLTHLLFSNICSYPGASSTCLTAAIHLSRPTVSLEYIVVEEETKYVGEMWVQSLLFILFLVDSPFPPPHLQILYPTASSTCPTSLDTHPSSFDWLVRTFGVARRCDLTVKTIIFWPFILCDTTINLGLQKVRQNVVFRPHKGATNQHMSPY